MNRLDRFVRRETAGLTPLETIDAASELRAYITKVTQTHVAAGMALDKAERRAIADAKKTFGRERGFRRQTSLPRIGWLVAGLAAASLSLWAVTAYLIPAGEPAHPASLAAGTPFAVWGDFVAVEIPISEGAASVRLAVMQGGEQKLGDAGGAHELLGATAAAKPLGTTVAFGFPAAGAAQADCGKGEIALVLLAGGQQSSGCVIAPEASGHGSWRQLAAGKANQRFDEWQPLLVYRPGALAGQGPGSLVTTNPGSWIVVSVLSSRTPLLDVSNLPAAPGGADLLARFDWLAGEVAASR